MSGRSILAGSAPIAFVPTTDPSAARSFYESVLGLRLISDELPFALVFASNGIMLRITKVAEHTPAPFTILGWQVESIDETVVALQRGGVELLRYPGMNDTQPLGIWTAPSGARVAWFRDPAGNVLSVTEFPSPAAA